MDEGTRYSHQVACLRMDGLTARRVGAKHDLAIRGGYGQARKDLLSKVGAIEEEMRECEELIKEIENGDRQNDSNTFRKSAVPL